MNIKNNSKAST